MRGLRGLTAGLLTLSLLAPAAVAKPGDLIVGDSNGGELVRVKPSGATTTLSADPDLLFPAGSTFSAAGRIFAADYDALGGDGAVFSINPLTGAATPFEDDDLFSQPIHLDYHPNGFLYVPDFQTDVLAKVNPVTGAAVSVGDFSSSDLDNPVSVGVLPNGSMIVGLLGSNDFLRVQPNGSAEPIATSGDP